MVYPHLQFLGQAYPDRSKWKGRTTTRELDSRTSDGIHVRLLWHRRAAAPAHNERPRAACDATAPLAKGQSSEGRNGRGA